MMGTMAITHRQENAMRTSIRKPYFRPVPLCRIVKASWFGAPCWTTRGGLVLSDLDMDNLDVWVRSCYALGVE